MITKVLKTLTIEKFDNKTFSNGSTTFTIDNFDYRAGCLPWLMTDSNSRYIKTYSVNRENLTLTTNDNFSGTGTVMVIYNKFTS